MVATSIVTDSANEKLGLLDVTGTELDQQYGILRVFQNTGALFLHFSDLIQVPLDAHKTKFWST